MDGWLFLRLVFSRWGTYLPTYLWIGPGGVFFFFSSVWFSGRYGVGNWKCKGCFVGWFLSLFYWVAAGSLLLLVRFCMCVCGSRWVRWVCTYLLLMRMGLGGVLELRFRELEVFLLT